MQKLCQMEIGKNGGKRYILRVEVHVMSETFDVLVNLSPYYGQEEGVEWIKALKERAEKEGLKFFLALPFDVLNAVAAAPAPSFVIKGAQAMNPVTEGSFTEAISTRLLSSIGASFVLLGTRRARREGESNETIRDKLKKAKEGGVMPVLCIGETAEERQQEQTAEVLTRQVGEATLGMDASELAGFQVVYEAPWIEEAFSRPEDREIDHAYQFCRDLVHSLFGEPLASSVKVYCPVPSDLKQPEDFIHHLTADGFYFCDPHQLTAIDEKALQAKVSTARKVREAEETIAAVEPAQAVAKQALQIGEEALVAEEIVEAPEKATQSEAEEMISEEEIKEEAMEAEELVSEEKVKEEARQPEAEEIVSEEEMQPEEIENAESTSQESEEEAAETAMQPEVASMTEELEIPETEAIAEIPPVEEPVPEEKPKRKPKNVKVSNISGTVAEAKKRKKKAKE